MACEKYMITDYFANIVKKQNVKHTILQLENIIQEKATTSITVKEFMESKAARNSTFPIQVLRTMDFVN